MSKYFILILISSLVWVRKANGEIFPDSTRCNFSVSGAYQYGFIIAHRPSIVLLQRDHVKAFELVISKPTMGNKTWQQVYNYPSIGVKYFFFDLGNSMQLGFGQALIPFLDFQLNKNRDAQLHFTFGWGIGYIEKTFDVETNYKNIAIGSHWNAALNFSTSLKVKLLKKTFLDLGFNLTHFSNGSVVTPNLGINIASLKAGIIYNFGEGKPFKRDSLPPFQKHFRNSVYVAGAIKQIYPVEGPDYAVFILSATRLKQLTRKKAIGLGIDFHYDESIIKKLENDTNTPDFADGMRAGINASYEIIFSDFSILLQMGGYVYNQIKSDGIVYQRLGLRYQFSKNLFVCYNLKTHWGKADFFEWGVGIRL